ncbi:MAG: aldo/keto reductase [Bdellovibrionota bacterium]
MTQMLEPLDPVGLLLQQLWLGTWNLGGEGFGPSDEREARHVLETAFERGARHFDTAGLYGRGHSEKLLAKVLGCKRKQVFIATKGGLVWNGRKVVHDATRATLRQTLHESLDRLNTDYIDLYQLHWPDPSAPIEESIETFLEFKSEGLIRHWGVCNLSAEDVIRLLPKNALITHQIHHNPIHRADDVLKAGMLDMRCYNCIYSPLEQGLLAGGKSSWPEALGLRDVRRRNPYFKNTQILAWVSKLRSIAERNRLSLPAIVLQWILKNDSVHALITGPRTVDQLMDTLGCFSSLNTKPTTEIEQLCSFLDKGPT